MDNVTDGYKPHYSGSDLTLYKFPSGPYDNNSYLLICPQTNESILIDTPADATELIKAAKKTEVRLILITHGHFDHIMGYEEILNEVGAQVGIGKDDAGDLPYRPDLLISDGDYLTAGTLTLKAISTPGHTPGSTCFVIGKHLFTGDTLFPGGPGKSDSPRAFKQVVASITSRLFVLEDTTTFYPGHGASGSLQKAKDEYATFSAKRHPDELHGNVVWTEQ